MTASDKSGYSPGFLPVEKLGILNDGIGENTGTANNGASRHFAGYPFNQTAIGPIDIAIEVCHPDHALISPQALVSALGFSLARGYGMYELKGVFHV
jgi:hypothetical protein